MKQFMRIGKVIAKEGNRAKISLPAAGACGSCSARGVCGETSGRTIEVECADLEPGQSCEVGVPGAQGLWAALLAFGVPTIFLFLGVFLAKSWEIAEGLVALVALGAVLLSLLLLWFLNPLWKKWFPLVIAAISPQGSLPREVSYDQQEKGEAGV
jgi:positive regulator of sigma E activity